MEVCSLGSANRKRKACVYMCVCARACVRLLSLSVTFEVLLSMQLLVLHFLGANLLLSSPFAFYRANNVDHKVDPQSPWNIMWEKLL